ncbi:hypothetical protein CFC35_35800 [Streptomyces sp. FBKL.4005]|uniref:hypothetical protein n=1 Tax=Streptomyces sp. FBKL.4005 TaxID=2015515 RepID=UPI000B96A9AB|nr:hypothetical protein [Streptomyces sp. FBKL.4005]OYP19191.1 hypothetical protein CFC35_35800 [Streptomyces sp. FBKL.4005]
MNPRTQQCAAPEAGAVTPTEVPNAVTLASVVSATVALTALQPEDEARIKWSMKLPANLRIRREARMRTRMRLTIAHWTGDIDAAARVAAELADNAVKHGGPFLDGSVILRLSVDPKTGELLVEVDDANPAFLNFEEAQSNPRGPDSGLGFVQHQRARLEWHVLQDDHGTVLGKTVKAFVSAPGEEAA